MHTSPRIALIALAALSGCTEEDLANYTLSLIPVTAPNQDPFDDLNALELVIEEAAGDVVYDLAGTTGSPTLEELGAIQDASLAIRGYVGDTLHAFGRTPPVTLDSGSMEVSILIAEVNAIAELQPLEEARYDGAMAHSGDGRFYLFGGSKKHESNAGTSARAGRDTILEIALASPDPEAELTFVEIGTMPEYTAGDETTGGRVRATATLLTGDHDDVGKILVAGGGVADLALNAITDQAFLFDPETGEIEELGAMTSTRMGHVAVENSVGEVIFIGGLAQDASGALEAATTAERYDPETRTFTQIAGNSFGDAVPLYGVAASLGEDGVLYCGGFETSGLSGFTWKPIEDCLFISNTGTVSETDPMETPVLNAALTSLGDGQALLTGGVSTSDFLDQSTEVEGIAQAWLYDHNASPKWKPVGSMSVGRMRHSTASLSDGRALIVGGSLIGRIWAGYDVSVTSCIEIFDLETYAFTYASDDESCTASLATAIAETAIASDPLYGVIIAGGDAVSAWIEGKE